MAVLSGFRIRWERQDKVRKPGIPSDRYRFAPVRGISTPSFSPFLNCLSETKQWLRDLFSTWMKCRSFAQQNALGVSPSAIFLQANNN